MNVVLVEMKDGATVIAESVGKKKKYLKIKYPMTIDMQPDGQGNLTFVIDKYMKFNKKDSVIKLTKDDFYYSEPCDEDYEKLYLIIKEQYSKIWEPYIKNTISKIIGNKVEEESIEVVLPTLH